MFPFHSDKKVTHLSETIIVVDGGVFKRHSDDHDAKWFAITTELAKTISTQSKTIRELISPPNKPIFALTTIINNQKVILMADIKLVFGTPNPGIFTLLDNKTLKVIDGVVYSNQAVASNSNPELATISLDPSNPNQVIGNAIAQTGSGSTTITTDAAYTDPGDGQPKTGSFSVTKNYTIVANADGATFDVVFQ